MAAYLIAEHIITDPAKFEEYRSKVGSMMAKYGGCTCRICPISRVHACTARLADAFGLVFLEVRDVIASLGHADRHRVADDRGPYIH
jgi:hypothetical protein